MRPGERAAEGSGQANPVALRNVVAGTDVAEQLSPKMPRAGVVARDGSTPAAEGAVAASSEGGERMETANSARMYILEGRVHLLPSSFVLPRLNVRAAFRLWYLGSRSEEIPIPPLRFVKDSNDVPRAQTARFSVWSMFFKRMEMVMRHRLVAVPVRPTVREVENMYAAIADVLVHAAGEKERAEQLMLDTMEKRLRKPEAELLALADALTRGTASSAYSAAEHHAAAPVRVMPNPRALSAAVAIVASVRATEALRALQRTQAHPQPWLPGAARAGSAESHRRQQPLQQPGRREVLTDYYDSMGVPQPAGIRAWFAEARSSATAVAALTEARPPPPPTPTAAAEVKRELKEAAGAAPEADEARMGSDGGTAGRIS